MKVGKLNQDVSRGTNIAADKVNIDKFVQNIDGGKENKEEKIPVEDNSFLHNLNLKLYGFLYKKFGILKTGIVASIASLLSILWLYQDLNSIFYKNNILNFIAALLLIYSLFYFRFFFNKDCPKCRTKFSLLKQGTYKVGEFKLGGESYDKMKIEFKCNNCGYNHIEEDKEAHNKGIFV